MSWLSGSVEPHFILNLRPYKTAKEMWTYLLQIYQQENSAHRFHLQHELAQFNQGILSIQEYYSSFMALWTEYTELIHTIVKSTALPDIQALHETSQRDQFLMHLRSDFEMVRSNLLSRSPSPSLDTCLNELLREEQRMATQSRMAEQANPCPIDVAYMAKGGAQGRDLSKPISVSSQPAPSSQITQEMVNQMILNAFSALGVSGSGNGDGDCKRP
ncbi:hypothetical protein EZV62_001460 [Acer yangbiense]|uniref:Retrotransposon gag domain-containing protein n=1 Tax=Acer yangbiense TaxID=1000413 RepID=A0A5C7IU85_9ROSI|nr:hypothetical protein EZV62_001460 [Acer yangbiense]